MVMNTILIPTDLHIASLHTLKIVLEREENVTPNIVLMYSEYLSDNISDLLFYSHSKMLSARISPSFKEALEILTNRYKNKFNSINIRCYHGVNKQSLSNFLEANAVSHIFIPQHYQLKTKGKAFNPIPMLQLSNISITKVDWATNYQQTEQEQLISLFKN